MPTGWRCANPLADDEVLQVAVEVVEHVILRSRRRRRILAFTCFPKYRDSSLRSLRMT